MLIVGLTGGIASGKNYIAEHFKKMNIPTFDADFEVHKLFLFDQKTFDQIKKYFPKAIENGIINRTKLGDEALEKKERMDILEKIIYSRLHLVENKFLKECRVQKKKIAILNIPLLFEKGGYKRCHKTIAVLTPKIIRQYRFNKRVKALNPEISQDDIDRKFKLFSALQSSDSHKKKMADFIIYNGLGKGFALKQIKEIYQKLAATIEIDK